MSSEEESYHITSPRGICLIINNEKFPDTDLNDRCGSSKDASKLSYTFGEEFLGFEIRLRENISECEFNEILQELQQHDHSSYSALVVVLLSHGSRDVIYTSDSCMVSISRLEEAFKASACPSLRGKPKVVIIQACQGDQTMLAIPVEVHASHSQATDKNESSTQQDDGTDSTDTTPVHMHDTIPDTCDFLFAYATAIGYKAYRDTEKGSWFIQQLCATLQKHAHNVHLVDMLTMVINNVSSMKHHGEAETPKVISHLRKKLYLHPIHYEIPQHTMVCPSLKENKHVIACMPKTPQLNMDSKVDQSCYKDNFPVESAEYKHTRSSPRGYCIIVDNTDKWKGIRSDQHSNDMQEQVSMQKSPTTIFLEQTFGQEFGLHVQTYLGLTQKVLQCLLEVISDLDHKELECFVLIVLSKGKDKAVYDVSNMAMPIPSLLEHFSDQNCPSLAGKPKLFLFHNITPTAQPAKTLVNKEKVQESLPKDSLLVFSNETEDKFLQSLLDLGDEDKVTINTIIKESSCRPLVKTSLEKKFYIYKLKSHHKPTIETKISEVEMLLKVLHSNREKTIRELKARKQKLKKVTKRVRISRVVGSSVGCVGGCVSVVGVALVPFTAGGSLALTIVGSAAAAAGGLTSFGASSTDIYIICKQIKKAKNSILLEEQFHIMTCKLKAELEQLMPQKTTEGSTTGTLNESIALALIRGTQGMARLAIYGTRGAGAATAIGRVGLTGSLLAVRVGTTVARGVAVIGAVAAVITIPIDSIELGYMGRQLQKGKQSRAEKWLQKHITRLEAAQKETHEQLNFIREERLKQSHE